MTLRLKLLIAMVLLVVAGLAASGFFTYSSLRNSLFQRVDQQLETGLNPFGHLLAGRGGPGPGSTNGFPVGTFAELLGDGGRVIGSRLTVVYPGSKPLAPPALPSELPRPGRSDLEPDWFVTAATDGSMRFRVVVERASAVDQDLGPGTLVVAIPLRDVDQTLHQLLLAELLVAAAVVIGLGLISWWLVRRELRPLEEIGVTAGAIAEGDLTRRVPQGDPRTEVGHLGVALNAMLAQIEQAFAERKASEERLRRFLADASHELRTPLTSIRGYAELFRRGASERQEDLAKSMRRIEDESARMGLLVEDLLLLARLDENRGLVLAPADVSALAADAVADARAAEPNRPVSLDAPSPVVAEVDEARLRQVAANLLANALFHTPPGTPVTVRVFSDGPSVILEVADRGPGLSPEEAARAFEPFYRADPSRDRTTGGAGLGLSIVAAIAEAHGGRVDMADSPGGGATFRVTIPIHPVAEASGSDGAGHGPADEAPIESGDGAATAPEPAPGRSAAPA